jgi:hypothetical protein
MMGGTFDVSDLISILTISCTFSSETEEERETAEKINENDINRLRMQTMSKRKLKENYGKSVMKIGRNTMQQTT